MGFCSAADTDNETDPLVLQKNWFIAGIKNIHLSRLTYKFGVKSNIIPMITVFLLRFFNCKISNMITK